MNNVDAHIASRLKAARLQAGLSQQAVGDAIGVSFQQIQKYEKGINRVSSGRLIQIAGLYSKAPAWFSEGVAGDAPEGADIVVAMLSTRRGVELARSFLAIDNAAKRDAVANVAAAFAGAVDAEAA